MVDKSWINYLNMWLAACNISTASSTDSSEAQMYKALLDKAVQDIKDIEVITALAGISNEENNRSC